MTDRSSQDQTVNNFGHVLLDICKSSNLQIVNGRYYKDSGVGNFTCHTANGGHSVVDYLLAPTSDLQSVLSDFEVGDMCPLSADHCPLIFSLKMDHIAVRNQIIPPPNVSPGYRYVWSHDHIYEYQDKLNSAECRGGMQTAIDMISDDPSQVATAVQLFSKCIENAATHFKHIIRDRNHDTRYNEEPARETHS